MPKAAPRPCNHPGCGKLVHNASYCEAHQKAKRKQADEQRGNANERGYGRTWRKAAKAYLNAHPLCQCNECKEGDIRVRNAYVVDHIIPHKLKEANDSGDPVRIAAAYKLFWDSSNWQSMAEDCHNKKTAREDGGFGRR